MSLSPKAEKAIFFESPHCTKGNDQIIEEIIAILVFLLADYGRKIGLDASQASLISALLNLGQGFGRPPVSYFSDSIGRIKMAALTTLSSALLIVFVWTAAKSFGYLIFFALAGGTVTGSFWVTISPVAVEVVGLQDLPSALSLEWLVIVLPCSFSEPIALQIFQVMGNYLGTQLFVGASCLYRSRHMCAGHARVQDW